MSAGEISDDRAQQRPDQVRIDVVGCRYPPCDIVLRQLHRRAERTAGERKEQDPRQSAAASGYREAQEKTERQVEEYVCNEVAAAWRFRPTLYQMFSRTNAAFRVIEGERVERPVKGDGDDDRRRNQKAFIESVWAAGSRRPICGSAHSIGSPGCTALPSPSGVNCGASAGIATSASVSGVQPPWRCTMRTGRI